MNIKLIFWKKIDFNDLAQDIVHMNEEKNFRFPHNRDILYRTSKQQHLKSELWFGDTRVFCVVAAPAGFTWWRQPPKSRSLWESGCCCLRKIYGANTHTTFLLGTPSTMDWILRYGNVKSYSDSCSNCGLIVSVYERRHDFCQGDSSRQLLAPKITSEFVQSFTQSCSISLRCWAELSWAELSWAELSWAELTSLWQFTCTRWTASRFNNPQTWWNENIPHFCLVRISAGTPTILPEVPYGFPQCLLAKATIIHRFWPSALSTNDSDFQLIQTTILKIYL
jgi:hypothetical protein